MMTPPPASPQPVRRPAWALWTALLAMLLALQVSAGAIRPATLVEAGTVAAKLSLPAPLAAQFRDTGHALKAAAQRLSAAKPQDGHDGAPPLPSRALAVVIPARAGDPAYSANPTAPRGATSASAYRARAPPLPA